MTNETSSERSALYEVGFQIVPTLGEDGATEQAAKVAALVSARGPVSSSGEPRLVKLAYKLTKSAEGRYLKFDTAYFAWVKFTTDPASVAALEEELKHQDNLIRFLLVKTVPDSDHTTAKLAAEIREAEKRRERPEPVAADDQPATDVPAGAEPAKTGDVVDKAIDALVAESL